MSIYLPYFPYYEDMMQQYFDAYDTEQDAWTTLGCFVFSQPEFFQKLRDDYNQDPDIDQKLGIYYCLDDERSNNFEDWWTDNKDDIVMNEMNIKKYGDGHILGVREIQLNSEPNYTI